VWVFLLIRFADVMLSAPFILAILAILAAYRLLWDEALHENAQRHHWL
jgi:ABC-type dipeptide/oligopeptide/nickel transport system permease subunit